MCFIPQENVVLRREWLRKEENAESVVSRHHPPLRFFGGDARS